MAPRREAAARTASARRRSGPRDLVSFSRLSLRISAFWSSLRLSDAPWLDQVPAVDARSAGIIARMQPKLGIGRGLSERRDLTMQLSYRLNTNSSHHVRITAAGSP